MLRSTHHLSHPPTLHQSGSSTVSCHSSTIVCDTRNHASHGKTPEQDAKRQGHFSFDLSWLLFEMERTHYGHRDDSHID